MRKTVVKPLFRMSFGSLEQLGDKADILIERDAAPLLTFGIDAARRTQIKGFTTDLKNCLTDEELKAAVGAAVVKRDKAGDDAKVLAREILLRAKSRYGEHTPEYRAFGSKGMDELDPSNLCRGLRRMVRAATAALEDLEAKGLTQAMIDALAAKVTEFDTWIDKKIDADMARDGATSQRVAKGNILYSAIIEVFDFGKGYWVTRDESKYNDYVIYNTPSMKKPEPGQYGAAHGSMLRGDNNEVPVNPLVFIDSVVVPIEPDENGDYEMDTILTGKRKITATADDCEDYESEIEIIADQDITFDIVMTPKTVTPPPPGS